jgi:hypothetical protein
LLSPENDRKCCQIIQWTQRLNKCRESGAGGRRKIPRTRQSRPRLRLTYTKFERFSAACLAAAERVPSPACSRRSTSLQISLKFSLRAIFSMLCPGRNRVVHAAFPESYRPPDHLGIGRKSQQSLPGRKQSCRDPALGPSCVSPMRRSNANSLSGENSARFPQIYASLQRDNLRRHF